MVIRKSSKKCLSVDTKIIINVQFKKENFMKFVLHLVLTSFLLLFVNTAIVHAKDSLKVITYNIEGMKPGTDSDNRIKNIIVELKNINSDIIALQEINDRLNGTHNQGQIIADSLSAFFHIRYYFYQAYAHLSWDNQFRESIGIISKYPVKASGHKQLSKGMFYRQVIWNYIKTPLGKINIFTTHLSFNSSSVRIKQVEEIKEYIAEIDSSFPASATILTGDFNDVPNSVPIRKLTDKQQKTFFIDSFAETNPNVAGNTIPAAKPKSKIDYIFYKNNSKIRTASSDIIMKQAYRKGHYNSDHLGVMTLFYKFMRK